MPAMTRAAAFPLLAAAALLAASSPAAAEHDLVLRGGTLYRGGLALAGPGDVAIEGDRIVAVGKVPGRGRRELDVRGRIVAPGFIDLHNHTDEIYRVAGGWPLPSAIHEGRNYLTQGVTTIVTGNCGSGFASPEAISGWLARVDELPYGTNVAHLIPHGQLRREVMGEDQAARKDPHPTPAELARMRELVDGGMRAGAFGLATGLEYDPGARAGTLELVELARAAGRHGGLYASHTRHEGPDPVATFASYAEAVTIGEQAGVPAHVSHIKLSGRKTHGYTHEVIGLVEAARARGQRVTADQYPYTASSTTLAVMAPAEMRKGMRAHPRFCGNAGPERDALRAAVARFLRNEARPEEVVISVYPWRWWWQGKTLAELAREQESDPADLGAQIACGLAGAGIYHSQSEKDVRAFMTREWVATASDGTALIDFIGRFAHPRAYGTFPRKLRHYALDEDVVTLPFALRSMTELPAEILGLGDRGRLAPGAFADVVVFDPKALRDVASFERSGRHSTGIDLLLVNGVAAVEGGEPTGERAGRALRNPRRLAGR
jgi:N-acyl-D-aspartate/D-glutamate deacylase